MERDEFSLDPELAHALRRLNEDAVAPPADPAREAALLAAFDAHHHLRPGGGLRRRRDHWYLAACAAAAALLLAVGLPGVSGGRRVLPPGRAAATHTPPPRDVPPEPPGEFVLVPGAAGLPTLESGTLVRLDVPVSMLPSLGVAPPAGRATVVKADLIVAQDGLPRAVRLVN
jgi:hypothetical protein